MSPTASSEMTGGMSPESTREAGDQDAGMATSGEVDMGGPPSSSTASSATCFAMKVTEEEEVIVREDGEDSDIGDHYWMRMIKFIHRVEATKVST